MATQGERRAETRARLLEAAARLFAERGIEESSIDAIADQAGRTSGAVYDHFGGKDGILFALLEDWVDEVTAVIGAELLAATTLDERLATLWRNVVDPPTGGGRWIALEHELWSYATRNEAARRRLAERYRAAWDGLGRAASEWAGGGTGVGAALIGVLIGLEMMRRVDPGAVPDEVAIVSLRAVALSAGAAAGGTAEAGAAGGSGPSGRAANGGAAGERGAAGVVVQRERTEGVGTPRERTT